MDTDKIALDTIVDCKGKAFRQPPLVRKMVGTNPRMELERFDGRQS